MMSFVVLVMTVAPLLAPMLGGVLMVLFSWHAIFWAMAIAALIAATLVAVYIKERCPKSEDKNSICAPVSATSCRCFAISAC
jgi:MFS transporter, DHA1 family, multidrug resistance protein